MAQTHAPRGPIKTRVGGDDLMDAVRLMDAKRCTAKSKQSGQRCKRSPHPGAKVCVIHGGGAPQVKQAAMERLRALQHPAVDALQWLITQRDFPSAAMSAARDVMDRTEGKAPESMDLHVSGQIDIVSVLRQRHQRFQELQKD